ncbi:MAG: T9SS type A sorting domain-containing protein [Saprospiraceae bacterium]|nr:T9SS type A sorting domain-containing protein [Saprospiraceae bacterium]
MQRTGLSILVIVLFNTISIAQNYYFKSGFESNVYLNQYELNGSPNQNYADIYGTDSIYGYDWENDLDNNTSIGTFRIYYEIGDTLKARASIVNDPLDNANKVLKFQLDSANVPNIGSPKGRIQASINNSHNLTTFSFKVKLYIHPDIDTLKSYNNDFNWLTLMEFWNNGSFQPFPFRITLNIQKPDTTVGSSLYFGTHGQTKDTVNSVWVNVWEEIDYTYTIPTGQWLIFETFFLEGDSINGRYKVTITDTLNNIHTLFDITNYTHHPLDPFPDGVKNFNPMKLYTSGTLIDGMSAINTELSVLWDDFEIWIHPTNLFIKKTEQKKCNLFPNPITDFINIHTEQRIVKVQIFDASGKLHKTIDENFNRIDMSTLKNGIYLINIQFKNAVTECYKVIKTKL